MKQTIEAIINKVWEDNASNWCHELSIDIPEIEIGHGIENGQITSFVTAIAVCECVDGKLINHKRIVVASDTITLLLSHYFNNEIPVQFVVEYITHLLAHEVFHQHQFKNIPDIMASVIFNAGDRSFKALNKHRIEKTEIDADTWAYKKVSKTTAKFIKTEHDVKPGCNSSINKVIAAASKIKKCFK